jgi:hypothetical protein
MRLMAQNGMFKAFDIGEGQWQDVDTPEAFEFALKSIPMPLPGTGTAVPELVYG